MNGEMSAGFREWIRMNKMDQGTYPLRLQPFARTNGSSLFLQRTPSKESPGENGSNAQTAARGRRRGEGFVPQTHLSTKWGLGVGLTSSPLKPNQAKMCDSESDRRIARRRFARATSENHAIYSMYSCLYRVTIQLVTNLPLTSKQKFRFGLARSGQAKIDLLF